MVIIKECKMKKISIFCTVVIFSILLSYILFLKSKNAGLQRSLNLAEAVLSGIYIVEGLEKYQDDFGAIPDSLNELVPKYITRVHEPKWGEKWKYYPSEDKKSYILELKCKYSNDYLNYDSEFDRWMNNPLIDSEL